MSSAETFLQEYKKLFDACPHRNFMQVEVENCEYTDFVGNSKDCYYCFDGGGCEGISYSDWIAFSRDSCDCSHLMKCELCYECLDCDGCFNCDFLQDCSGVKDSRFCLDCKDCSDCFMCCGLRHKRFFVLNEECAGREEYDAKVEELVGDGGVMDQERLWDKLLEFSADKPRIAFHSNHSENCVGDYFFASANVYYGFGVIKEEDSMYVYDWGSRGPSNDNCDCCLGGDSELCYEGMYVGHSYNCNFCYKCRDCSDLEFCVQCVQCQDCFGCAYLKHKQYYILNKQYKKAEYFEKVAELKKGLKEEGKYRALWA